MVAHYLVTECKRGPFHKIRMYTFGTNFELVGMVERSSFHPFADEVIWTFF